MGLLGEGITEVIAVTQNNAAPIGIIVNSNLYPTMVLYKGSVTASNVLKYHWITANFVSDSYLYPKYTFSDVSPEDLVDVFIDGVMMQRLSSADAWMAFRTVVVNETQDAYYIELKPISAEYIREDIRPVNRGFNSVIDATVYATRYVKNHDDSLRYLIQYHLKIISKCGGSREKEASNLLREICKL
ncbi:MAG TPA: DUF447 family protein [Methanocorpusculum sp.]|nr:DUF447 family protein [Methanocorpusculum sp.]